MSYGWLDDDTFRFFVDINPVVVKGGKNGADKSGKRWIQGIASTDSRDLQGEIVSQGGIDVSYFLKHGWFNNDHKDGFQNKVGQPTEARVTKDGLFVKGYLFKDHKVADEIWELMNSIERSGSNRKIGFSIQGKVKHREGTTIKECWLQDIAITPAPVNTTTWAEIVKSMSAEKMDLCKDQDAGDEDEEKALSTSTGAALIPESLDKEQKKDLASKGLFSQEETVNLLVSKHGLSHEVARSAAVVIFDLYGKELT